MGVLGNSIIRLSTSAAASFLASAVLASTLLISDASRLTEAAKWAGSSNISMNIGERIYHVRGQEYYSETVITSRRASVGFARRLMRVGTVRISPNATARFPVKISV